jgi:hypothetical protein
MTETPDTKIHCLFEPGTDVRFNYKPIKKAITYKYPGEGWATIYPSGEDSTLDYTTEDVSGWYREDLYRVDVEIAINGRSFSESSRLYDTPCNDAPLRLYTYSFFVWGELDTSAEDGNDLNNGSDLVLGTSPYECSRGDEVGGYVGILCKGILYSGLNLTELPEEGRDNISYASPSDEKELVSTFIIIDNGEPGLMQRSDAPERYKSSLLGVSYYSTYSLKDDTTDCKFTVTENGKTIFERTEKECPEIKYVCTEQDEQSIDINTIVPLLSGIEVKGSVEFPSMPDNCIEIWRYIQGAPLPTQMKVKRLCSEEGCPPPKYTVNCEPCCPSGLIEVKCGDSICCYNKQGEAVKQCP